MNGFPFDSRVSFDSQGKPVYDRAISSLPMRKLINKLLTNGVLPNPSTNLQVSENDGMTVVVSSGFCIIDGCLKYEENNRVLSVTAADNTYDRIDTVVMRLNDNTNVRTCDLYIVQGIPQAEPVRPALTRTESINEIGLADLFIPHGVSTITDERITDTRYEDERCGVISSIAEFDTDTIYQQVQADLSSFKANEQADFIEWFNEMKDQLSEDAAGHLQNEIDELEADVNAKLVTVNKFNVATTDWTANTDTTTSETYPYIAEISSTLYTDESAPIWQMNGVGTIPTDDERDAINLIMEAIFDNGGVTLYATDAAEVALVLEVKGA